MKADIAYNKTRETNLDEKSGHYPQCIKEINNAIVEGNYSVQVYINLEPEVKERLKNENYVVNSNSFGVRISWDLN